MKERARPSLPIMLARLMRRQVDHDDHDSQAVPTQLERCQDQRALGSSPTSGAPGTPSQLDVLCDMLTLR